MSQIWYLTAASPGYLSQFLLALLITIDFSGRMLLSGRAGLTLRDGYMIGASYGITLFSALSFLAVSALPPVSLYAVLLQPIALAALLLALIQFAYLFPDPAPAHPRERKLALAVSVGYLLWEAGLALWRYWQLSGGGLEPRAGWMELLPLLGWLWVLTPFVRSAAQSRPDPASGRFAYILLIPLVLTSLDLLRNLGAIELSFYHMAMATGVPLAVLLFALNYRSATYARSVEQLRYLVAQMEERINHGTIALVQAHEKYRDLFEFDSDANFVIRAADGRILEANSAAAALYGYTQAELRQMRNVDLSAEPEQTRQKGSTVMPRDQIVAIPLRWHRHRNGTVFPVELTARFIEWDHQIVHTVSIRDITERHKTAAELERLAAVDVLTGVHNRRYFFEHGQRTFDRAQINRAGVSIFMLDIDHFKRVNDVYGHMVGDLVICEFACRIQTVLRPGDLLARYGGEEFIVLMPELAATDIAQIAERLLHTVNATPFQINEHTIMLTVSIGVAPYSWGYSSFDQQIDQADQALYRAKQAGRNCWSIAQADAGAAPALARLSDQTNSR
jgi:diguanylate cyclase (GGDEF)-like protein/PAS domain S-box-containing protein